MRSRFAAVSAALVTSVAAVAQTRGQGSRAKTEGDTNPGRRVGVLAAIGNTPLIELRSLSRATGCRILAKCEHLNPGGSVKDRAALWMIEEAERTGKLKPGGTICEGTGGNTGVGLAMVAAAKGYNAIMCMPQTIAREKINAMRNFGAQVMLCPPVPFTDSQHYFQRAKQIAASLPGAWFSNQFENLANARAHRQSTAPEIFQQTGGKIDGFVASSGTGGTIAGCGSFLKFATDGRCLIFLVDPPGSGLFDHVTSGGTTAVEEDVLGDRVTFLPRSQGSSIAEGIGIGRLTSNFRSAPVDGALRCSDRELVEMAYHLKEIDGVFVGPSAALNVVGACKLARKLGPGHTIVTILCDGGARYSSKLYNEAWLAERGLTPIYAGKDDSNLGWLQS